MNARSQGPALDRFRLAAAVLVVCIHTGPLATYNETADFWLCGVIARIAVPFFLMVSGYFLARDGWNGAGRFLKKTARTYLAAVLLCLPLNLYQGGYGLFEWGKRLLLDGTLYHPWYFPALLLGVPLARGLARLGRPAALAAASGLYLLGLGGDSYYALASRLPGLRTFYDGVFVCFTHTRNGLFYVPLFLLLGAEGRRRSLRASAWGAALGLALLSAEGFALRALGWPRHDSMYLTLPPCMACLFSLLLNRNQGEDRRARRISLLVYLFHPWFIVLARVGGLAGPPAGNSLIRFAAVLAASFAAALALDALRPLRPAPKARAWREIDLEALGRNAETLRSRLAPGCELMAVVKADGYGHGAVRTARCLQRAGVRAFAVACLEEGTALRRAGIWGTILILGYTPAEEAPLLRRWRLTQTVADEAHGRALNASGVPLRVHLAVDSGMGRLGVPAEDAAALLRLCGMRRLRVEGMVSHLCVSDSPDGASAAYTQNQLRRFYAAVDRVREGGFSPGRIHIQASYGILNLPPQPCGYARAGIVLYGVDSGEADSAAKAGLRPVLSLRARVVCLRRLRPGEGAGYGLAFRAERDTLLAVVSIGYADGLPRELARKGGRVLLHGRSCPMAGRMCMDQLFVDVTELPEVRPGDTATLIGRDGGLEIRAEELAQRCGTIANELLSRLGPSGRLPAVALCGKTGRRAASPFPKIWERPRRRISAG